MRLKENGNWKANPHESHNKLNHFNIITKIVEEIPTISMPTDRMLNRQHIKTNFETLDASSLAFSSFVKVRQINVTPFQSFSDLFLLSSIKVI